MLAPSPGGPVLRARVPGKVLPVDVEIIAFDVFGTLVDWHTSIVAALAEVGGRAGIDADWAALASAWRARYRPTLARVVAGGLPFESMDTLHRMMLDELAADGGPGAPLQALSDADRDELVRAWHRLRPWPDSVPALTKLREHHILTPLSNGGMGLLTRLARAAGLPFDCILSAELAGTYKPDPRVYRLVSRYLDVPPDRVLMVACHPDDLEAAARENLRDHDMQWDFWTLFPESAHQVTWLMGDRGIPHMNGYTSHTYMWASAAESAARAAGVSRSWLCTQPDIRDEVLRLRGFGRRSVGRQLASTAAGSPRRRANPGGITMSPGDRS